MLSQDNDSKNVSVQWFVKIRFHILPKSGQPRENVSVQWLVKIRIHVLPKPGQPGREC